MSIDGAGLEGHVAPEAVLSKGKRARRGRAHAPERAISDQRHDRARGGLDAAARPFAEGGSEGLARAKALLAQVRPRDLDDDTRAHFAASTALLWTGERAEALSGCCEKPSATRGRAMSGSAWPSRCRSTIRTPRRARGRRRGSWRES
jgi:hypothetical protein